MDDIRRQDMRLFIKELLAPSRLILTGFLGLMSFMFWKAQTLFGSDVPPQAVVTWILLLGLHAILAHGASVKKRFVNRRFEALWTGCEDRLIRFREVLRKLRREQIAELNEMPKTIEGVGQSLYAALRRADMISHEVQATEQNLYGGPPIWQAGAHDPQSKELYRIADKNIAEYRQRFEGVMAGVQRTEAQSAVYMTTLDTLRMKMLGYRLVGKGPEMNSQDFLEALNEAKLQLQAIDTALEELELGPYPQMIAAMPTAPPPIPEDIRQRLGQ